MGWEPLGGVSIPRGLSFQSRREGVGGGFLSRYRTDH